MSPEELLRLHEMLCKRLYEEQMDLELEEFTVCEEAIKAMREDDSLVVWFDGGW